MKKCLNGIYDGSCMMENILIEAQNQGLGACWIHCAKRRNNIRRRKRNFKGFKT